MSNALQRFYQAQEATYQRAFDEIRRGRKEGHWMWFIFPQILGLGYSETSRYYAIRDLGEAALYLQDEVLGKRLIAICGALLSLEDKTAHQIFGSPDDLKLKSSMTLFACVAGAHSVFQQVLDHFFEGKKDPRTLELIGTA